MVNHYGAHATAAYGAVNQVLNYIQFPALSPFQLRFHFCRAIGAGKPELLAKVTRTALGNEDVIFTGSLITLAYLFSKYLMALFITDHSVIELRQQICIYCVMVNFVFGASAIFASIMRASGTASMSQ